MFPRTVRASSRPGPDRRYEELTGRQGRSKPRDERMKEQSRRRGAQQGAEGELAGRAVGADFLMTYWAVSPHPHRVAHFKYHAIVLAQALNRPDTLVGSLPHNNQVSS